MISYCASYWLPAFLYLQFLIAYGLVHCGLYTFIFIVSDRLLVYVKIKL